MLEGGIKLHAGNLNNHSHKDPPINLLSPARPELIVPSLNWLIQNKNPSLWRSHSVTDMIFKVGEFHLDLDFIRGFNHC